MTKCIPCPPDPCERIVQAIAIEQEQLARILTSLADKAEKAANWLPETAPDEPFNVIVDKVRALEGVMAQEISALANVSGIRMRFLAHVRVPARCSRSARSPNGVHGYVTWT